MKTLVLAEKPSVARDIARVLKCSKKLNGALEGERYIVTWALGHLVTLADPEEYDKKYKEWNMEVLPMMPKKMELVVIKQTQEEKENWLPAGFWKRPSAESPSNAFGFHQ